MGILSSKDIGDRLRELRKRRGLTLEQLAEIIDVRFQQIQKYENGTNRLNTDKLQALAQALVVPTSYFFDEDNYDMRLLSDQELKLINSFRALSSQELRDFVLHSLLK